MAGLWLAWQRLFSGYICWRFRPRRDFGGINMGDLLTLGCAVSFAFQIIILGRAMQKHAFAQIVVVEIATCGVLMLLSAPLLEKVRIVWSPTVLWALAITSLVSTCARICDSGLGAAVHAADAHGPDFLAGAGFRLDNLIRADRRAPRVAGASGAGLILAGVLVSELLGQVRQPEAELVEEVR